jgi:predicted small lipoprotein YifL
MKKKFALLLAIGMVSSTLGACGAKTESSESQKPAQVESEQDSNDASTSDGTIGETLSQDFMERIADNADISAEEMANALLENPVCTFAGATMTVEEGFLNGFTEEITGFQDAVMFSPMIGSIPFVGYIFALEEGADVAAFTATLESAADPNWNICTLADETIVEASGNTVFFLMCPYTFDEE